MEWEFILGTTGVAIFMVLITRKELSRYRKKERAAFLVLAALGWLLACLLILFPDMPGPTQLVDKLYKPFWGLLEK